MKKINVEYGVDGRIIRLSDNAVHYEQENLTLHIDAIIPTDKNVRGYIKAPNGNSNVTDSLSKTEGVYTLVVEETFMAKGTLYVGFEAYDDNGYIERFEPLKVYIDSFVNTGGGNTDNVYVVTVEIDSVETLPPDGQAYVENVGNKKDVKLKFGIPQGIKGEKGDTATVSVGTVETVPPNVAAYVENVGTEHDAVLNFYITKGDKGDAFLYKDFTPEQLAELKGEKGDTGTIEVGTVTTLAPDETAYVTKTGNENAVLDFGIPKGDKGEKPVAGQDYWTDEEKTALLYDAINSLPIDAELNVDSSNPVQNRVIADTVNMLARQIDDKVGKEDGKGLVAVDDKLDSSSQNPVQNKVVNHEINKIKRAIDYDVLVNNIMLDNIDEDNLIIESSGIEAQYIDKEPHAGYYDVIFKDARARQMLKDIHMQKIFETTTTEVVEEIAFDEDMDGNSFVLDEIYITVTIPAVLTESVNWGCYVNGQHSTPYCLFYFKASTSGTYYMAKAERMSNGLWDTLHFSNLSHQWSGSSLVLGRKMPSVDYINKVCISCPGLPIGSTITVCGRKVVE